MDELNEAAPHECTACGSPSYIGFSEIQCTNKHCEHYEVNLWVEWVMTLDDSGDPPPLKEQDLVPPDSANLFRDFCSNCHTPQYFNRHKSPSGLLHAFCKQCGKPNTWCGPMPDDEDTQPQLFKSDLGLYLDDEVGSD